MEEKKYVIPDGMLEAARLAVFRYVQELSSIMAFDDNHAAKVSLEAALAWLAGNPIVPTDEQAISMIEYLKIHWNISTMKEPAKHISAEWQRRMFLEPEPEIGKSLDDLLYPEGMIAACQHNDEIKEAFRRGQKSKGE